MISIHDNDFNVLGINKAFASDFEIKAERLRGQKGFELFMKSKNISDAFIRK